MYHKKNILFCYHDDLNFRVKVFFFSKNDLYLDILIYFIFSLICESDMLSDGVNFLFVILSFLWTFENELEVIFISNV